jgi:hypothetical protein
MALTPSSIVHAPRIVTPTVKLIAGRSRVTAQKMSGGNPGRDARIPPVSLLDLHFGQAQSPGTSFRVAGLPAACSEGPTTIPGREGRQPAIIRGPNPGKWPGPRNVAAAAPAGAVQVAGAQEDAAARSVRVPVPASR